MPATDSEWVSPPSWPTDDSVGAAQQVNMRLGRLAEALAPEAPWPTDEEFPREAFHVMWRASWENRRRQHRFWGIDPETEPLFDVWMRNLEELHAA